MATGTIHNDNRFIDKQISIGTSSTYYLNLYSDIGNNNIKSLFFMYSDDLYYALVSDNRILQLSVGANGHEINVTQGTTRPATTRNLTIRVYY